ncbi:MAG: 3-deoxy-8-phosphooctulonate synthase [Candidatus Omnitrophota bacterium]
MSKHVTVESIKIGPGCPLVLIAGPCVIESQRVVMTTARRLTELAGRLQIPLIFKASYDKANRTSLRSYRGPGIEKGLEVLAEVRDRFDIPVLTDVHTPAEAQRAGRVVDILQIPAFLCRQTDLLAAAAKTGKVVNIKKGQYMAPWDMAEAARKVSGSGNKKILLTDRGTSFGYNTLVSDMRGLKIMRDLGYPVVFDATHSVQQPGGRGKTSGGESCFVPLLSRSAVAAGCDAVFMEVHPDPQKAKSDGPNMLALDSLEDLLVDLSAIHAVTNRKNRGSSCR